jgi:hypothetical protein
VRLRIDSPSSSVMQNWTFLGYWLPCDQGTTPREKAHAWSFGSSSVDV